eukprot:8275694-Lingulodinium_polyedra.AAC.1
MAKCWTTCWRYFCGSGLVDFLPEPDAPAILHGPSRRKTLALHQDEGSAAYAPGWYLLYHLKLRLAVVRDPFHREWNDMK